MRLSPAMRGGPWSFSLGFCVPLVVPLMNEVTRMSAIEQGDAHAAEQLLPLVYDELRNEP